jgi:ribonuclease PH
MQLPEMVLAITPRDKQIAYVQIERRFHVDYLEPTLLLAIEGCLQIHRLLDIEVRKRTIQLATSLHSE